MKKIWKGFLVVIVTTLIILFAQYGSGILIEQYYKKSLSHISEKYKVELKEFKRGFFTSHALIEINKTNAFITQPNIIAIHQNITHGPFIIDFKYKKFLQTKFIFALAHIHHELDAQFKAKLLELFNNEQPFTIITKLNYLGNGTTFLRGIPIKQTTETKFDIMWDGLTGKINHSLDLKTMKGEIIAPKLNLQDQTSKLNIANIKFDFDTKENNNLDLGSSNIHIDNLAYYEQETPLFKLINLNIKSTLNKEKQQKLRYTLTTDIENSQILKQSFTNNTYQLTAHSITSDFFNILHANYDKKLALLDDLLRQLLNSQVNIDITLPKYFSHSLISFGNFQLYKNSILGKIDPRQKEQIFTEISNTITSKFDDLVARKIFIDNKDEQQYQLHVEFDRTGKILLNGEQLQNPFQALQGLAQPKQEAEVAEPPTSSTTPQPSTERRFI